MRGPVAVNDHKPSRRDAVVQSLQDGLNLLRILGVQPEEGEGANRRLGERARRRSLQEHHEVLEQAETGKALPHGVEIPRESKAARVGRSVALKLIGDPYPARRHLVGLEKAGHEDGGAASPGSCLDEIALDRLVADHLQTALQVVEANATQPCIRDSIRRAPLTLSLFRERASSAFPAPQSQRTGHVAVRIAKLAEVDIVPGLDALQKVIDAQFVLEVVLVEQRVSEEVEVPANRSFGAIA